MALGRILDRLSEIQFASLSVVQLEILGAIVTFFLWSTAICIYRLYFSPLAKFPGDKLAAVTGWVETYHDVFRGGQLIFKLAEWHAKYGMFFS
jgi:hypothetical protein